MTDYSLIKEGRKKYPQGIPLSELLDELVEPRQDENPEKPEYYRFDELLRGMQPAIKYQFDTEDQFKWDENAHWLPHQAFDHFTTDEKMRFLHNTIFSSDLGDFIENNARYGYFKKIVMAYWHWGHSDSYTEIVQSYNSIRNFSFGIKGFETHLDYTTGGNEYSWGNFHRNIYLDAEFGFCVYYKGEHVLTIGFAPCKRGVLLAQVQCAKPKGNRWLFKLKTPLMKHVVNRLQIAFPGKPIWFINGKSLAEKTKKSYESGKEKIPEVTLQHIIKTYTLPVPGFRKGKHYHRRNLLFKELQPI